MLFKRKLVSNVASSPTEGLRWCQAEARRVGPYQDILEVRRTFEATEIGSNSNGPLRTLIVELSNQISSPIYLFS